MQVLPGRQLAVLIVRDVLGYHANEVAGMLDATSAEGNAQTTRNGGLFVGWGAAPSPSCPGPGRSGQPGVPGLVTHPAPPGWKHAIIVTAEDGGLARHAGNVLR